MQSVHNEIKRNKKYKEKTTRLQSLKDEYAASYKAISEAYWPIYDQTKKEIKNKIYKIGLCICLILIVTVCYILDGLKNEYLIGGCYGISCILLALAVISYLRTNREAKAFFSEWNGQNKKLKDIQEEIKNLCDDLVEEMLMIICYNTYHYNDDDVDLNEWDNNYQTVRNEILNETSDSLAYDDVLSYFENWVEKF